MHAQQPLRVRTFVWTHDQKNDRTGWLPENAPPNFYPGTGFMVAHDTVEHFGNKEGWDRELTAFGATLYSRAHDGIDMLKNIVTDFVNFMNDFEGWHVPTPKAKWYKKGPTECENMIDAYLALCRHYIGIRVEHYNRNGHDCDCGQCKPFHPPQDLDKVLNDAAAWFRRGWRLAQRLHHGRPGQEIVDMEARLAREVDGDPVEIFFGYAKEPKLGDKLTVTVNRKANTFQLTRTGA